MGIMTVEGRCLRMTQRMANMVNVRTLMCLYAPGHTVSKEACIAMRDGLTAILRHVTERCAKCVSERGDQKIWGDDVKTLFSDCGFKVDELTFEQETLVIEEGKEK